MARRKGWRAVKSAYSFTIDEVARNQGVVKGTVTRWIKAGLPCLKDQRPFLIQGQDLVVFLKALKTPKQKCQPSELYCFKCKAPRKPALKEAEFRPNNPASGRLTALCSECATIMNKNVSNATLEGLKPFLCISFPQATEPLSDATKPRANDNLGKA
jgi:hypothetical protein